VRICLICLFLNVSLLAGVSSFADADIIKLKNGQEHEGTITVEEEKRIQLKLESGVRIWFQKDQIASTEKTAKKEPEKKEQSSEAAANTEGVSDDVVRARELLKKLREQPQASAGKPIAPVTDSAPATEPVATAAPNQDEIQRLIEVLQKGQYYDRLNACKKLGSLGAKDAIPHLIHYLDDEKFTIRDESNNSLKKITGQDFGFNSHDHRNVRLWAIDRWKQWYEGEKKKEGKSGLKSLW
jgi:hypothetical protein